jgi:hypothetical protein
MFILWIFGNAVCSKIGNAAYAMTYLLCGLVAAATHNLLVGAPALGASGAINGVVGFYIILYPRNTITCFWIFLIRFGTFEIAGGWLVLVWLVNDIWGALSGESYIGYWAHLGGLFAGAALAFALLHANRIEFDEVDIPHLLSRLAPKRYPFPPVPRQPPAVEPTTPANAVYFVHSAQGQIGPFTSDTVRILFQSGQIHESDWVFDPDRQDWVAAREFLRIF